MNKLYKRLKKISDRVREVDKRAVQTVAVVVMLFIAVWAIYAFHLKEYANSYRDVMSDFIMSQTEQESESISHSFSGKCSVIEYATNSIANVREEEYLNVLPGILSNVKVAEGFEYVVFINPMGTVYFSDGTTSNDYDSASVMAKCDTMTRHTVFYNTEHYITNVPSVCIIAPISSNDEFKGYLCGIANLSTMVETSEIRQDIVHDEVILDESGRVVAMINSKGEVKPIEEDVIFFDMAQSAMTATAFADFAQQYNESISAGAPGKSYVATDDGKIMFIYYPIEGSNGWSVMDSYPEKSIQSKMTSMYTTAVFIFMVIVGLMIIAGYTIYRYLNVERKKLNELEYLDGLTGVYNRNAFVNHSEKVMEENSNLPYYMICFDVVNFRIINETYGHERSDVIIKEMANACKEAFGHNEAYGRLTADVFVACTLDDGEEDERIAYIEQRVAEEAKKVFINHPIKIKRGRYEIVGSGESINRMIDKANIARKYVNINSNVLSCQYSEELMNDARKKEEIESKMERALANGEFKPFLQPKFDMSKNHISGAEALVRWIQADGSIVSPGDFIPLFEENGFVEKVDFYILEEICKYIRKMLDENREVYKVSVNQSRYLMNDPEYVNKVKDILLKYQIPLGLIELELTETVFFHEKDRMIKMMNDLKAMNVDLSIDDFGSGYSSFNILKDVPFDVLKIDREFLSDSVHTEKGKWILKEIIEMAHGLGMSVICEGVETQEQIDLLLSINCKFAQGFFYSRPIPMEEFIGKYNNER